MGIEFIIYNKDGTREHCYTNYDENDEYEVDDAWEYVRMMYPDADYIERF